MPIHITEYDIHRIKTKIKKAEEELAHHKAILEFIEFHINNQKQPVRAGLVEREPNND